MMKSLSSRLVVTAVLLVAVVSLLIGTTTTLVMRDYLTDRLDEQVRGTLARVVPSPDGPPVAGAQGNFEGIGTLTAVVGGDGQLGWVNSTSAESRPYRRNLATSDLDELATADTDGQPHDVELAGLGHYRVITTTEQGTYRIVDGGNDTVVTGTLLVGLPAREVDETISSLIWWEILLGLLGVAAAGLVGTVVVRRQLAPLREVAATAHEVAALPLDSGEVDLSPRVREPDEDTEVGQVGAALNSLLAHVETSLTARHRSEQQVRQFVADASHELRTPLSTIRGYAELSRRTPGDAAALSSSMVKVSGEADRMTSLVDDLLLLARLDAGRPLASEPVDLTRMLLEAVADARVLGPGHRWRLQLPDQPVEVLGDEQRLHQVITNLLTNARRHTPEGTTVTVSAGSDGHGSAAPGTTEAPGGRMVEVTVADDGPGFPDGMNPFERFTRGDVARTRVSGGAGLGLSIVAAIVRAHGGDVRLSSTPGATRVTVRIPARPDA